MKKIVISPTWVGFGLSHKAKLRYAELAGFKLWFKVDNIALKVYGEDRLHECPDRDKYNYYTNEKCGDDSHWSDWNLGREDSGLIQVIEEMGDEASAYVGGMVIVEVPDNVDWILEECEGCEWIAEKHRVWGLNHD